MKRWSDFYDSMDPKNKHPSKRTEPIDVTRSATVKYFSVYPRKADQSGRTTPANPQARVSPRPTAETSFQGERYTSRPNEFGTVPNRVDAGHTNFAWVD